MVSLGDHLSETTDEFPSSQSGGLSSAIRHAFGVVPFTTDITERKKASLPPPELVMFCNVHAKLLRSCLILHNPMDLAYQAPLSMAFSRQESWSELPFPPAGDLPDPGIKLVSLRSPALAGKLFATSATWEPIIKTQKQHLSSTIWCRAFAFSLDTCSSVRAMHHLFLLCKVLSKSSHKIWAD